MEQFSSLITKLDAMGLIAPVDIDDMETMFIEFMSDEFLPERWKIDFKSYVTDRYEEVANKYDVLAPDDDEDNPSHGDLEKYLEEVDDRTMDEVVADDKKEGKERKEKERKQLADKIDTAVEEQRGDIVEHLKKLQEAKQKELDGLMNEINRLESGKTLEITDDMREGKVDMNVATKKKKKVAKKKKPVKKK